MIILNYLISKPVFFKTISESVIYNVRDITWYFHCVVYQGIMAFSNYQFEKVMWPGKKEIIEIIEKYRVVEKNLREWLELGNAYDYELH